MKHPLIKSNEFLLSQAILGKEIMRTGESMLSNEEWNSICFEKERT